LKLKMYDKQKALELLGKDIGMFKEQLQLSGSLQTISSDPLSEQEWLDRHSTKD
jgi:hypothetical protein